MSYICKECGAEHERPQGVASCMAKHHREARGVLCATLVDVSLVAPVQQVTVLQIEAGKQFEHEGVTYKKTKLIADKVIGWYGPDYYQDKAFDLDTLVTPK